MKALLAANGATINTLLLPGKSICLPDGAVDTCPADDQRTRDHAAGDDPAQPTRPAGHHAADDPASHDGAAQHAATASAQHLHQGAGHPDHPRRVARRPRGRSDPHRHPREQPHPHGAATTAATACSRSTTPPHKTWLASMGITSAAQLYDPRVNATAALALYNKSGWAPWATTPTTSVA